MHYTEYNKIHGTDIVSYCNIHGHDFNKYRNCLYAYGLNYVGNEKKKHEFIQMVNDCMSSGMSQANYAISIGKPIAHVVMAFAHLRLLDDLEKENNTDINKENELNFVPLKSLFKSKQPEIELSQEPQDEPVNQHLITCQNDIEITIRAGIKVTLGQHIGMDKIMKIVELMRNL